MTLYTVADVARELSLHVRTVRDLAHRRGLGTRMGRWLLVFSQTELDNMRIRTGRWGPKPPGQGGK